MKKGGNSKNLGSIVIPKARGARKYLFCVSAHKETEDMSVSLPCIRQAIHCSLLPHVFCPGRMKGLEDKTYSAMDSPVHGEPDGVSCILIEDCICKL